MPRSAFLCHLCNIFHHFEHVFFIDPLYDFLVAFSKSLYTYMCKKRNRCLSSCLLPLDTTPLNAMKQVWRQLGKMRYLRLSVVFERFLCCVTKKNTLYFINYPEGVILARESFTRACPHNANTLAPWRALFNSYSSWRVWF